VDSEHDHDSRFSARSGSADIVSRVPLRYIRPLYQQDSSPLVRRRRKIPRIAEGASSFQLRVARSPIHRFGVFALQSIPAGRKVIEYTGERMSLREWRRRARAHPAAHNRAPVRYFSLNPHWGVDASVGGNGAELINHCCDPNLHTRKIRGHILYFSRRKIHPGEELTVDYRFRWNARRDPCHCGSPKCRGTINLPEPAKRASGD
jgi:hypothetical protein